MGRFLSYFLMMLIFVPPALAQDNTVGELKIIDEVGLIRASRKVISSDRVSVKLKAQANQALPGKIKLSKIDGIASDIEATSLSGGEYFFKNVGYGNWVVKVADKNLKVVSVKIGN